MTDATTPRKMTFDMTKETAGRLLVEDGDKEFTILDAKPFWRDKTDPNTGEVTHIYGVRYSLRIDSEGEQKDKTFDQDCFLHSKKTGGMNKQFLLAALGYTPKREHDFNETYADPTLYDVDFDNNTLGEVWKAPVGRKIMAVVKTGPQKNDPNIQQNSFRWMPFN